MVEIDANIVVETEHLGSNNGIVCTSEGLVLIDREQRCFGRTQDGGFPGASA